MDKRVSKLLNEQEQQGNMSAMDALRTLAGFPIRGVQMAEDRQRTRIVEVHRDGAGNVVSSVERITESEHTNIFGNWSQ